MSDPQPTNQTQHVISFVIPAWLDTAAGLAKACAGLLVRYAGAIALAMLLGQHQGCVIPWPPKPPVPPVPPTPVPPVPPQPPSPIPGQGLRVLVVYDQAAMTPQLQTILQGASVRGYLDSRCAAGPDGKTREYRILPRDASLTNESPLWQQAFGRQRSSLPWIVIGNGTTGFEGALPSDEASVLALLKKYGGG